MREISLFIVLALNCFPVQAEDYLDMDLESLMKVKITGSTLREESVETVPSSVTVFTRQQIDRLGVDYLHELVSLVPGFQMHRSTDNGFNYSLSARGRRQTTESRELMLIVDGRVLTSPISGGADTAVVLYSLANVERVEVIRGPGSSIYGSGAMMGVINIVTRSEVNQVRVTAGSQSREQIDLQWGGSQQDWRWDLAVHGLKDQGDEYSIKGLPIRDPRRELMADLKLVYQDTQVSILHSSDKSEGFYTSANLAEDYNDYQKEFDHIWVQQAYAVTEDWQMDLAIGYQEMDQDIHVQSLPAGALAAVSTPSSNQPLLVNAIAASHQSSFKWANDMSLSSRQSIQWGLEWSSATVERVQTWSNFETLALLQRRFPVQSSQGLSFGASIMGRENKTLNAIYGQYLLDLNDKTRLTMGLRHDDYRDVDSRTSPRLGLVYMANDTHTFKLLYGEAFRAPSLVELYTMNNSGLLGNPDLVSERVKTCEFIWQAKVSDLSSSINLFSNKLVNPIINDFQPGSGIRTYASGPDADYQGGEFNLDWQPSQGWLLSYSFSWMNNLPEDAFREANRIQQVRLQYEAERWSWNLSLVEQGDREYLLSTTQRARLDSDQLLYSRIHYQLTQDIDLDFTVKNLGDSDVRSSAHGVVALGGVPHRGREWALGLTWGW